MTEKSLTARIKSAQPNPEKSYTIYIERQLVLRVDPNGGKYFIFRYQWGDRQRPMGLGAYPETSLAEARGRAEQCRKWLAESRDPISERRLARAQAVQDTEGTFSNIAAQWLERNRSGWSPRNLARHESILRRCLLPTLGDLLVSRIDANIVLATLEEVQRRSGIQTAYEARTTASMIFNLAITRRLVLANPARDLQEALQPRPATQHYEALPLDKVGPMLRALSASGYSPITQAAIRLLMLTAPRDNALRSAQWKEVDLDERVWICPASHMKGRLAHRTDFASPLPRQAIDVLRQLRPLTYNGPNSPIFRGAGKTGRLAATTMNDCIKACSGTNASVHGMRAMVATWADAQGYPAKVVHAQLAHVTGDKVARAYFRGEFWQPRVELLDHWAATVAALEHDKPLPRAANVTRLPRRSA